MLGKNVAGNSKGNNNGDELFHLYRLYLFISMRKCSLIVFPLFLLIILFETQVDCQSTYPIAPVFCSEIRMGHWEH